MSESSEQIALIEMCAWAESQYPELAFLHHSPNGGRRSVTEAKRFKKEGVRAGFPDLFLAVAKRGFNGLFIEMKCGKNKLTLDQKKWQKFLAEQNYKYLVCYSANDAFINLKNYLKN